MSPTSASPIGRDFAGDVNKQDCFIGTARVKCGLDFIGVIKNEGSPVV